MTLPHSFLPQCKSHHVTSQLAKFSVASHCYLDTIQNLNRASKARGDLVPPCLSTSQKQQVPRPPLPQGLLCSVALAFSVICEPPNTPNLSYPMVFSLPKSTLFFSYRAFIKICTDLCPFRKLISTTH